MFLPYYIGEGNRAKARLVGDSMQTDREKVNNQILPNALLLCRFGKLFYKKGIKMVTLVAEKLRAMQKKAGISTADWAKISNVSEGTIRKILMGNTGAPRIDTLKDMVESLGVSVSDFLSDEQPQEVVNNAAVIIKDVLETRIDALKERQEDLKQTITSLRRMCVSLSIALAALVLILVAVLIVAITTHGWIG